MSMTLQTAVSAKKTVFSVILNKLKCAKI